METLRRQWHHLRPAFNNFSPKSAVLLSALASNYLKIFHTNCYQLRLFRLLEEEMRETSTIDVLFHPKLPKKEGVTSDDTTKLSTKSTTDW
ncbi:hypothetical protein HanRHA438_Chr10g0474561 [Helianthus annuus]|uniref:Uncharacterized protein n=1 Tax=Helianthus annuus TaxID=4232 RepID=A0A251TPF7_HELAN|nr:hypothetical protein HanXRQr2_Chr10g0462191 [Helianthus annuus]KAJ0515336.1 hypothetical protein HanHA300_Chr10g0379491 [Helianthus annuus]KAJ0523828.1 hypothetical protein HanIR_Chr10g0498011 [Helianthus annuus]KAJ0531531.1 hypothetical protein HanHA89_Chr10g0402071 [Helianthus annuus]KAJ0698373.1 hypothetical protein HanLR1_Chr10g0379301 [Helianthus annuus]